MMYAYNHKVNRGVKEYKVNGFLGRFANFRARSDLVRFYSYKITKHRFKIMRFAAVIVLVVLSFHILPNKSAYAYSGLGEGTQLDPYRILNCSQLQEMKDDLSAHYALYADINCNDSSSWNGGAGFIPVGECWGPGFAGSFDGRGHVITDLFINRPTTDRQALFGCTNDGAVIQRVGLQDVDITAQRYAGGIVGVLVGANSSINNSYVTGEIKLVLGGVLGSGQFAGGIASGLEGGSHIARSYSAADIQTHYHDAWGEGGIAGYAYNGSTVTHSFWDTETPSTVLLTEGGGTGKTTLQMKTQTTFTDAGWDFSDIWTINEDLNSGYPSLRVQGIYAQPLCEQSQVSASAAHVACDLQYSAPVTSEETGDTTWAARFRKVGDVSWTDVDITNLSVGEMNFTGLDPSTNYELSLKATNYLFNDWMKIEGTTLGVSSDVDSDGALDIEEDTGPNNADANDDGTLDSLQANVISYINPLTSEPAVLEAVNCTSISGFQIGSETSEYADANYNYPMGLTSFHILCPHDGDTATIRQYYYGVEGNNSYSVRKWMPDGSYREISGYNLLGIPISGNGVVFFVEYQITDGGEFDDDGVANGIVVDPSGPALSTVVTVGQDTNGSFLADTGQDIRILLALSIIPILEAVFLINLRSKLIRS